MRRRVAWFTSLVVGLSGLVGCESGRYVHVDPDGGTVAIPRNSNHWPTYYRTEAEAMMREHCPDGYEIVREEEVVTGQVGHTDVQSEMQNRPALVLAGAEGESSCRGGRGAVGPDSVGSVAIPLGPTEQTTHETTHYRDVTEWRITYRKKRAPESSPVSQRPAQSLPQAANTNP